MIDPAYFSKSASIAYEAKKDGEQIAGRKTRILSIMRKRFKSARRLNTRQADVGNLL